MSDHEMIIGLVQAVIASGRREAELRRLLDESVFARKAEVSELQWQIAKLQKGNGEPKGSGA